MHPSPNAASITPSYVARDWIKRARASEDPVERARCLRQAEQLIVHVDDWNQVAHGWVETPGGQADARRCAEQAVALAGAEVGIYSAAASVFARHLEDPERARAVLDQCRAALAAADRTRVGQWTHLGRIYVMLLDARDASRACLEVTSASEMDVRDLCDVAGRYAKDLGDLDMAHQLIARALELATQLGHDGEDGDWWTLANALLHTLDDVDAAWRALELGLALAKTTSRCIRIAHAIASHGGVELEGQMLLRAALSRAETFAQSTDDWLTIADTWHEHMHETHAPDAAVAIRRCLEQAAALGDKKAHPDIASRYHRLLEDAAAAAPFGPVGVSPWDLFTRYEELEGWHADPAALLDVLRARLTPEMLHEIARADWGCDHAWHLASLQDIQRTGLILQPLPLHPHEVLALSRWKDGIDTDHVARAFVCTVLCIDNLGPYSQDAVHESLAPLIESCILLGGEVLDAAIALVVALCEGSDYNFEELAFFNLGLLILGAARDPDDPRLIDLARWVTHLGDSQPPLTWATPPGGWLLGISNHGQRHTLWRELAAKVLRSPRHPHLLAIAERLRPADPASPAA